MKLIVKTTSCDIWWGIYGLTGKSGWEDLHISYENGEKLCTICLNAKVYLRAGLKELNDSPEQADFIDAVKTYLADNKIHYWHYPGEQVDEATSPATESENGFKISFMDIWHPDEVIGISTIKTAIQAFAMKFLAIENCEVTFDHVMPLEEAVSTLEETYRLAGYAIPKRRKLSKKSLGEIAEMWQMPEKEVLMKLKE